MQDRDGRIGFWVSGVAHAALILWALLGGVLLRPQPSTPVRMTEVATMSGTEFEAYASASRGAGPVGQDATAIAALPAPETEDSAGAPPAEASAPDAEEAAQELAPPDAAEPGPDLSDFQQQPPVSVASNLPDAPTAPEVVESAPAAPAATAAPSATDQPVLPAPAEQDEVAEAVAPRSPLALERALRPLERPEGLIEDRAARIAAQEAARQAAENAALAEAARQAEAERAAEAQAAAEAEAARQAVAEEQQRAAEARAAERQAAEQATQDEAEQRAAAARREAERQAAEAERRAAEARAEEERREAERQAAERDAQQRRAAEAEAARVEDERRAAAEREAAAREAAEQDAAARATADRQALEDALREAQEDGGDTDAAATASTGDAIGDNRQQIEGGDGASAAQDPLAAALSGALSQGQSDPAATDPAPDPAPDPLQLAPVPITPTPLPEPDQRSDAGGQDEGAVPLGQPLSLSEREGFRMAIRDCWNIGALSLEAARMDVSVEFRLTPDGRPDPATLRLVDQRGGSQVAAQNAFDVARRAIIMCGRDGYPLPAEKYGRWREVIVDFRPDGIGFE